jgi:hypothetical protein
MSHYFPTRSDRAEAELKKKKNKKCLAKVQKLQDCVHESGHGRVARCFCRNCRGLHTLEIITPFLYKQKIAQV